MERRPEEQQEQSERDRELGADRERLEEAPEHDESWTEQGDGEDQADDKDGDA